MIIGICDDTNLADISIYHIRNRKVDQTVTATEGYRAHCSTGGKLTNEMVVLIGKYYAHYVTALH